MSIYYKEKVTSFYDIAKDSNAISEWRKQTAADLFYLESLCLKLFPKQNTDTILKLSGCFHNGEISNEDSSDHHVLNSSRDDFSQPIKDIDRLICKKYAKNYAILNGSDNRQKESD